MTRLNWHMDNKKNVVVGEGVAGDLMTFDNCIAIGRQIDINGTEEVVLGEPENYIRFNSKGEFELVGSWAKAVEAVFQTTALTLGVKT